MKRGISRFSTVAVRTGMTRCADLPAGAAPFDLPKETYGSHVAREYQPAATSARNTIHRTTWSGRAGAVKSCGTATAAVVTGALSAGRSSSAWVSLVVNVSVAPSDGLVIIEID